MAISTWLIVAAVTTLGLGATAMAEGFHVAPGGSDRGRGTRQDPFATLPRARDAVRELARNHGVPPGGVTVWVRPGRYCLGESLALTPADSGTEHAPVVYRADRGGEVRISGAASIPPDAFRPVTDARVLDRLDPSVRGRVLHADLKALGIEDYGDPVELGRRAELFVNDRVMTLARWPNEGFTTVADVLPNEPFTVHGISGDKVGELLYEGDRPARWVPELASLRLHGYWFWDWSDQYHSVKAIDPERKLLSIAPPYHGYGYRKGMRFYACNVLCELDAPGEWYLDREAGVLYLYPPCDLAAARIELSVLRDPLVTLKGSSHVTLQGFTFEGARGTAVTVEDGEGVRIVDCTVRNVGRDGITVRGGHGCLVERCHVHDTGAMGVSLSGGDRQTLTPCEHEVRDSHIHDFSRLKRTYAGAVHLSGVGARMVGNSVHDGPHLAVLFTGNEHVMEYNRIHDVCVETGDVGVFYTGRDWTARGNVLRHNLIYDAGGPGLHGAQAIYLDDAASGTIVQGNVIVRVQRAIQVGGGRDNRVENNVIVDCRISMSIDDRGLNWMKGHVSEGGVMRERLAGVPYRTPPWSERYPELVNILDDPQTPGAPRGNVVRNNVIVRSPDIQAAQAARDLGTIEDNLVTDENPGFADIDKLDFRLRDDAELPKLLPGFDPVPMDRLAR